MTTAPVATYTGNRPRASASACTAAAPSSGSPPCRAAAGCRRPRRSSQTPTPTNVQAALLEHLVRTGRPWSRGLLLDSGRPPRSTTVDALFRNRWLLPVTVRAKAHGRVVTEPIGVLTPVGRRALQKIDPSLATGWSDEDRVRMREDAPLRCLGPYETEECERHQGELEVYRWSWRTPRIADPARHLIEIDAGEPEMVLACPRCRAELWAAVRNPDTLARLREYTPEGK